MSKMTRKELLKEIKESRDYVNKLYKKAMMHSKRFDELMDDVLKNL